MTNPFSGSSASSVSASGDLRIDALLSSRKWGDGPQGTGTELTYSFPDGNSVWADSYSEPKASDYRGLNATEQVHVAKALNAWAEVANIKVTEVADGADDVGDIRVAYSGAVTDRGVTAWAYYPNSTARAGDVWLNPDVAFSNDPGPGGASYWVFLHELGHALGLSHSFAGSMGVLTGDEDSTQYTVMAYHSHDGLYPQTPMLYDILAIQYMYGANYATRADDTTYTFSNTSDTLMTIWDGGGNDTINASNQTLSVDISLIEGTFSSIGPGKYIGTVGTDNVAIAYGVVIENATGGSGDDMLTGNAVDNRLEGGGGDDVLDGGRGADSLIGGSGGDTLIGGAGNDLLDGDGGDDWAVFSGTFGSYAVTGSGPGGVTLRYTGGGAQGDGTDQVFDVEHFVFADGAHTLADLLDQPAPPDPPIPPDPGDTPDGGSPTIEGTVGNDFLTGTSGDDVIAGYGGADVLKGRSGNDVVRGDAGNDTLTGNGGDDIVIGGDGADLVYGGTGNDTLDGGDGNDIVNGGDGDDRALFSGNLADYDISPYGSNGATVRYTGAGGPGDGTDTVSNVEWYVFKDMTKSVSDLLAGTPAPPPPSANDDPNAVNDTATTAEDQAVTIAVLANDDDPDGDPLAVTGATQGGSGQVSVNGDATIRYTPNANFNGNDSFTYTVADGQGGSDTATVTVTVNPVKDAPVAVDDGATTDQGQPVTLSPLANDSDPDGDALQLVSVTGASGGSVQINGNGTVTYTPNAGFSGVDSMTYTVRDPAGAQATASITVQVDADTVEEPPTVPGTPGADDLTGTNGDDVIDGYGGDDTLRGQSGDDVIRGGAGDDSIRGQKNSDTISGGAGDDTLKGNGGADWIEGGADDDTLIGGGGGDRFVLTAGFGRDVITDFGRGADTLDLTAFAIANFAAIDDDGDGQIETGEGGGVFTATVGTDTVLDFGGGNVLTIQDAPSLGVDEFEL